MVTGCKKYVCLFFFLCVGQSFGEKSNLTFKDVPSVSIHASNTDLLLLNHLAQFTLDAEKMPFV